MNLYKHASKLKLILVSSLLLVSSSACVTIQDGHTCAVAGDIRAGGICSHLLTDETEDLTEGEFLDFLSAQPERTCVPVHSLNVCSDDQRHGVPIVLPARAAAISMPAQDWGTLKTELEEACRELGGRCTYATQQAINHLNTLVNVPIGR